MIVPYPFESVNFYDSGRWSVSSGPAVEPVSRTDVKNYLKVDVSTDDSLIDSLIVAARNYVQYYTSRCLITQTIIEKRDTFTDLDSFPLLWGPVTSVTSIGYLDTAGASQTLSTDVYGTDLTSKQARIYRKYAQSWPEVYSQRDAITVTYVAGYADAASVPDEIKTAIYLMIADWYDNRTDSVRTMPTASQILLNQHRVWTF